MKSCFLFGHADAPDTIMSKLDEAIENCYSSGITYFYVGNRGRFDSLAASAVKRAKLRHPEIKLYLLLAYHPGERAVNLTDGFDGSYYPPLENVPRPYILVDGRHEAIIPYEQFQEAQRLREARAPMCVKRSDNEHAHLLATLIKCPVCGAKLYGNTTRKKDKNGIPYKDYHFYACKHRLKVNGATCTFRTNINERDIDEPVVAIISKLINDPHLAELLSSKLDNSTDKKTVEEAIQAQKKLLDTVNANIARLTHQLDHLDYSSPIAERKAADMENRLNNLYNEVMQHEQYLDELYQRLYAINQNLLTKDAVLNILKQFSKLYEVMTPVDRQILIRTIVDEIQIYPEKQTDGRIIKSIKLAIPIVYENGETPKISWDKETTVESIVCLTRDGCYN